MEFGVSLPGRGPLASPDLVLAVATRAERLRYASVFVSDHVVLPASSARSVYPYSPTGQLPGGAAQDYLEPLVLLAWLARATTRIRIGTSVLVVPYRHPLVVAKMLATLDRLAGGRVILGAGVGWLREEFEALGTPLFEERGAVTDEYLRVMRAAWTTDPVTFTGRYCRIQAVHALPKPVQRGGIPVWIGGHSEAAVRRAATLGDAWHPIGLRPPALLLPDEYAMRVKQLRAWAQRAGRDPAAIALTLRVPMQVRARGAKAPAGDRPLFQGTAAEVAADVRAYQALGVTHFVFDPTHADLAAVLANLDRFAADVRPLLRDQAPEGAGRERARARPPRPAIARRRGARSRNASRTGHPRPGPASRTPLRRA